MSSMPALTAPALTDPARANLFAAAIIFGLFVFAAIVSAERKDVRGFDEVAQASYVASIQHDGKIWPALDSLRLLDPETFIFTDKPNYLDHPPLYYALLAALGPELEARPNALLAHRLIDIMLSALGLAALLGLGLSAGFSRYEFCAFAVPLVCIPILPLLAGAINNDDLAFLGGAVAMLGAWQLAATYRGGWLALALIGVVVAAAAKLTGFVLAGAMVSAVVAYLIWRRRWRWSWTIAVALAFLLAAAPYVVFTMHYGSPAPDTPAQIAMIENNARVLGMADLPRKSFPLYLGYFALVFIVDWIPIGSRGIFNYAMLVIPVAALVCALAGVALSLRRLWQRREMPLDVIVIAGALALSVTLVLHVRHAYADYLATGWLEEAYPRYYLPLMAIVPLAGLSLLAAIESRRWRNVLLGFLIGGPIAFHLLGAPLG